MLSQLKSKVPSEAHAWIALATAALSAIGVGAMAWRLVDFSPVAMFGIGLMVVAASFVSSSFWPWPVPSIVPQMKAKAEKDAAGTIIWFLGKAILGWSVAWMAIDVLPAGEGWISRYVIYLSSVTIFVAGPVAGMAINLFWGAILWGSFRFFLGLDLLSPADRKFFLVQWADGMTISWVWPLSLIALFGLWAYSAFGGAAFLGRVRASLKRAEEKRDQERRIEARRIRNRGIADAAQSKVDQLLDDAVRRAGAIDEQFLVASMGAKTSDFSADYEHHMKELERIGGALDKLRPTEADALYRRRYLSHLAERLSRFIEIESGAYYAEGEMILDYVSEPERSAFDRMVIAIDYIDFDGVDLTPSLMALKDYWSRLKEMNGNWVFGEGISVVSFSGAVPVDPADYQRVQSGANSDDELLGEELSPYSLGGKVTGIDDDDTEEYAGTGHVHGGLPSSFVDQSFSTVGTSKAQESAADNPWDPDDEEEVGGESDLPRMYTPSKPGFLKEKLFEALSVAEKDGLAELQGEEASGEESDPQSDDDPAHEWEGQEATAAEFEDEDEEMASEVWAERRRLVTLLMQKSDTSEADPLLQRFAEIIPDVEVFAKASGLGPADGVEAMYAYFAEKAYGSSTEAALRRAFDTDDLKAMEAIQQRLVERPTSRAMSPLVDDVKARLVRAQKEAEEAERLEKERLEAERAAEEARLEAERLEAERLEAERLEGERLEAERLEAARLEAERLEEDRAEAGRRRLLEEAEVADASPEASDVKFSMQAVEVGGIDDTEEEIGEAEDLPVDEAPSSQAESEAEVSAQAPSQVEVVIPEALLVKLLYRVVRKRIDDDLARQLADVVVSAEQISQVLDEPLEEVVEGYEAFASAVRGLKGFEDLQSSFELRDRSKVEKALVSASDISLRLGGAELVEQASKWVAELDRVAATGSLMNRVFRPAEGGKLTPELLAKLAGKARPAGVYIDIVTIELPTLLRELENIEALYASSRLGGHLEAAVLVARQAVVEAFDRLMGAGHDAASVVVDMHLDPSFRRDGLSSFEMLQSIHARLKDILEGPAEAVDGPVPSNEVSVSDQSEKDKGAAVDTEAEATFAAKSVFEMLGSAENAGQAAKAQGKTRVDGTSRMNRVRSYMAEKLPDRISAYQSNTGEGFQVRMQPQIDGFIEFIVMRSQTDMELVDVGALKMKFSGQEFNIAEWFQKFNGLQSNSQKGSRIARVLVWDAISVEQYQQLKAGLDAAGPIGDIVPTELFDEVYVEEFMKRAILAKRSKELTHA